MSEPRETHEPEQEVTVANIQRLEAGYFDHMQSLRDQIPVAKYMITRKTGRYGLIAMALISFGLLVLFPLTMFYQYTYVVTVLYLVAFAVIGKVFYDYVMLPNEATETWRD